MGHIHTHTHARTDCVCTNINRYVYHQTRYPKIFANHLIISGLLVVIHCPYALLFTSCQFRFMRQYGPARSVPLCEDRLVMAPSVARLYPPCLLEWRANYTGSNMGIGVKFPDGTSLKKPDYRISIFDIYLTISCE